MKKHIAILGVIAAVSAALTGCAATEMRKVWNGMNISDVTGASRAYMQTFAAPPDETYNRVLVELDDMKVSFYKREDNCRFVVTYGYHAIYAGCIDTTEVGILVRDAPAAGNAEVLVVSGNIRLASRVARDLFSRLAGVMEEKK